ncbi:vanZ like family protein [Lysobacter capsici]|uniref:VanZ family protein n=1 Tax=Lysobacter capsici TaxID=435897 RepID=UPI0007227653|nr:VanZ family protein [Lysobacter capsici]ALN83808.1 vanZ like family protein [Lysobacter capsici]
MSVAPARAWLREFERPALWVALWLAMIAVVIATCLLPARDLPPTPFSQFDKIEHFSAYLAMSAYAGMLFARMRPQAIAAIGLIAMGVGLEFAQARLTDSRSGDAADALANGLGALAGLFLARTPVALWLQRVDRRLASKRS